MIRIRDITLPLEHDKGALLYHAAQALHIRASEISSLQIFRRSLDARKKPQLKWVYTVDVTLRSGESRVLRQCRNNKITKEEPYVYRVKKVKSETRPVVVGFGPAGMFAALVLALSGLKPIVLERGDPAPERREKVERFWNGGALDPESNVQFGEGGAGTFSDGKLHTGTKNERGRWVLEQFVRAGAQEEILYDAKPHVGTDVLFEVVQNLRKRIISLGGEVRFGARLTGLQMENGALRGAEYVQGGEKKLLPCEKLILAIGHSARDTFRALAALGVPMEAKPFSMGVRIEHKQSAIDMAQYGMPRGKALPAADYKLSCHLPDGSSAYTFCMCPGGYVVAAASQEGAVATNGMSYSGRGGENANAALLVTLKPEDFPEQGIFGGMHWQEEIEKKAFALAGSTYAAPAQTVGDFLAHRPSETLGTVTPTYRPGVTPCDLHALFPEKITKTLEQAIPELDGALHGFASPDAVMTAPETRSSSPIRVLRGENRQSSIAGLYPCGEGAGYAGGILSAAVDGMLCAEAMIDCFR
ncbi:MAG: NAD(P)/FAD-dependent oxidoreductase [Faecousia sp.]